MIDPLMYIATRRQTLLHEATQERLAAQLPRTRWAARRGLALLCRRLASWIDQPGRYVPMSEAVRADWAGRAAGVYIRRVDSITPSAARDRLHAVRRTNFLSR